MSAYRPWGESVFVRGASVIRDLVLQHLQMGGVHVKRDHIRWKKGKEKRPSEEKKKGRPLVRRKGKRKEEE